MSVVLLLTKGFSEMGADAFPPEKLELLCFWVGILDLGKVFLNVLFVFYY